MTKRPLLHDDTSFDPTKYCADANALRSANDPWAICPEDGGLANGMDFSKDENRRKLILPLSLVKDALDKMDPADEYEITNDARARGRALELVLTDAKCMHRTVGFVPKDFAKANFSIADILAPLDAPRAPPSAVAVLMAGKERQRAPLVADEMLSAIKGARVKVAMKEIWPVCLMYIDAFVHAKSAPRVEEGDALMHVMAQLMLVLFFARHRDPRWRVTLHFLYERLYFMSQRADGDFMHRIYGTARGKFAEGCTAMHAELNKLMAMTALHSQLPVFITQGGALLEQKINEHEGGRLAQALAAATFLTPSPLGLTFAEGKEVWGAQPPMNGIEKKVKLDDGYNNK